MPVGGRLQLQYLSEGEARVYNSVRRVGYIAAATSVALGVMAYATESVVRNVGGEGCEGLAGLIFDIGSSLMLGGAGLAGMTLIGTGIPLQTDNSQQRSSEHTAELA